MACNATNNSDLLNALEYGLHHLIVLPVFVLNISIVCCLLFLKPRLPNLFYKLYALSAIQSCFTYFLEFGFYRGIGYLTIFQCELVALFGKPSYVLTPFYVMTYYFDFSQLFCYMFITLNRMSAITMPVHHKKIWSKAFLFSIVFCLTAPFAFCFEVIAPTIVFAATNATAISYIKFLKWLSAGAVTAGLYIGVMLITTTCTVITLLSLRRIETRVKKTERALTLVSTVISVSIFLKAIVQYLFSVINRGYYYHITIIVRYYFADFAYVCGPLALVAMCSETRSRLRRFWGFRPAQITVTVPSMTTTSRH